MNLFSKCVCGSALRGLLHRFLAVDHPRGTEAVHEHTKSHRPKCFRDRHRLRSVFRQRMEYTARPRRIGEPEAQRETRLFLVTSRRRIRRHQYLVADGQTAVKNFCLPFRRHVLRHRRTFVRHEYDDLRAEDLLVELESGLTVAIEIEVRIHLNTFSFIVSEAETCVSRRLAQLSS